MKDRSIFFKGKTYLWLVTFTFLLSCNQFKGYKVSGTIKNAEGVKVYLEDLAGVQPVVIDTTSVLHQKFEMKNYSDRGIYRLRFSDDMKHMLYLCIQDKDNIKINADFNDLDQYTVEGSRPSVHIQQIMAIARRQYSQLDSDYYHLKAAPDKQKDSLITVFTANKKAMVQTVKDFVEKEENNDVACFALNLLGAMREEEIPYLVDITEKLHEADPKSRYINAWYASMKEYRDALMNETEGGVALNSQAPNIILQNPSGDTIQLKNLQGNYVLLDFWASWCGPCRHENPNVVKLYNKYHAQGFEIFSVSLDADKGKWVQAIAKDGLVWKNHGCDFGGWQSAPAQQYRVNAIPCTFLLDRKGKVIAKNLHGDELDQKLSELFSKPAVQ